MIYFSFFYWFFALSILCLFYRFYDFSDENIDGSSTETIPVENKLLKSLFLKVRVIMPIFFSSTIVYALFIHFFELYEIMWTILIPLIPALLFAIESFWFGYEDVRKLIYGSLFFKAAIIFFTFCSAFYFSSMVSELIETGTGLSASFFSSYENLWVAIFTSFSVILFLHIISFIGGLFQLANFIKAKKPADYIFLAYQAVALLASALLVNQGMQWGLENTPRIFFGQIYEKVYYDSEIMLSTDSCTKAKALHDRLYGKPRMVILPSGQISLIYKQESKTKEEASTIEYIFEKIECELKVSNKN